MRRKIVQRRRVGKGWLVAFALLATFASFARPSAAQDSLSEDEREQLYAELERDNRQIEALVGAVKKVIKVTRSSVVHIEAERQANTETGRRRVEESGSGVLLKHSGKHYVVTNRHVIRDAESGNIRIKLTDHRVLHPERIWTDSKTDVAVMAVTGKDLAAARLGDSDKVETGDLVLAIGSPFGLSHTVTMGIVSARDRRNLALGGEGLKYQDFLQTDAAINPGNSGGPLINLKGEIIGINTAIATESGKNQGIGFAIPANMLTVIVTQLVEKGQVQRAFLGVNLDSKFGPGTATRLGLPRLAGALVSSVTARSPAESAKITAGDVILSYNGKVVDDDTHLINMVSLTPVNTEVPVVIFRDGKRVNLKVKVGDRSSFLSDE